MIFLMLLLVSCNNQNGISKDKVVNECITIDEYNETQGFGAECKNVNECKDKLNRLIT